MLNQEITSIATKVAQALTNEELSQLALELDQGGSDFFESITEINGRRNPDDYSSILDDDELSC